MRRTLDRRIRSVRSGLEVSITLDDSEQIFTTGNIIHGQATIQSVQDLNFQNTIIELVGTSRTLIERWSATPGCLPYTSTAHNFLRLSQPDLDRSLPPNRTFLAGEEYTFDFTFVVPESLPEGICGHTVSDQSVRNAHIQLPPSLGKSQWHGKHGSSDDLSHDKGSISYGIYVTVHGRNESEESTVLTHRSYPLTIVSSLKGCSQSELHSQLIDRPQSKYHTRKVESVKGRGFPRKKRIGTLVAEAAPPKSIQIQDLSCRPSKSTTTLASANLLFVSTDANAQDLPQLEKVTTNLRIRTDISSKPSLDFPQDTDILFDASRLRRNENITLSELGLSGVQWNSTTSSNISNREPNPPGSCAQEASPPYETSASMFETSLTIPITLPESDDLTLVPTFHSCYISRTYALDIRVSYVAGGVRSSISLCLPLQLTTGTPRKSIESWCADDAVMASHLPKYNEIR